MVHTIPKEISVLKNNFSLKQGCGKIKSAALFDNILSSTLFENKHKIVALIGISKNAGKTTLLNWLLGFFENSSLVAGVMTTGRDGEQRDVVYGTKKPKIVLPANTLFITTREKLSENASSIEILKKLPYKSLGCNLWLARTSFQIETEIVGPPTVNQQLDSAKDLLKEGSDFVFIDGSLDRKAIANADKVNSILISISPAFGNLKEIEQELDRFFLLSKLEKTSCSIKDPNKINVILKNSEIILDYDLLSGHEDEVFGLIKSFNISDKMKIYLPGALTDSSIKFFLSLTGQISEIILTNPYKILLNEENMHNIIKKFKISVVKQIKIIAVSVNSYSARGNHIDCELLRKSFRTRYDVPVIDVNEIN